MERQGLDTGEFLRVVGEEVGKLRPALDDAVIDDQGGGFLRDLEIIGGDLGLQVRDVAQLSDVIVLCRHAGGANLFTGS